MDAGKDAWDRIAKGMAKGGNQNVASSRIVNSAAEECGNRANKEDKCKWLKENAHRFPPDEVRKIEKAWRCRNQNKQGRKGAV